jgi:hypothetical protein
MYKKFAYYLFKKHYFILFLGCISYCLSSGVALGQYDHLWEKNINSKTWEFTIYPSANMPYGFACTRLPVTSSFKKMG